MKKFNWHNNNKTEIVESLVIEDKTRRKVMSKLLALTNKFVGESLDVTLQKIKTDLYDVGFEVTKTTPDTIYVDLKIDNAAKNIIAIYLPTMQIYNFFTPNL